MAGRPNDTLMKCGKNSLSRKKFNSHGTMGLKDGVCLALFVKGIFFTGTSTQVSSPERVGGGGGEGLV